MILVDGIFIYVFKLFLEELLLFISFFPILFRDFYTFFGFDEALISSLLFLSFGVKISWSSFFKRFFFYYFRANIYYFSFSIS